jgi:hypothetical protein
MTTVSFKGTLHEGAFIPPCTGLSSGPAHQWTGFGLLVNLFVRRVESRCSPRSYTNVTC